jgi:hypothetical protein
VRPDSYLTVDCKMHYLDGNTWEDIAIHGIELEKNIEECTSRMRKIREDE